MNTTTTTIRKFEAIGAILELHETKLILKFLGGESRVIGTEDLANHFETVSQMLKEENNKLIKKNNGYASNRILKK